MVRKALLITVALSLALVLTSVFFATEVRAEASESACWGQATAVFSQTGVMGEHSSQQAVPRVGLRNLARVLYEQGVIPDDTLQSLGVFVTNTLGLSVDACR